MSILEQQVFLSTCSNSVMNVLPWLLDWPPSPAAVGVFLLVTAFSVGTLVLFGGVTGDLTSENVTVAATDITVRLNDDYDFPDTGNGSVQTCLGVGTPGDSISVLGDVTVDIPAGRDPDSTGEGPLTVVVSLAHTEEATTQTVERTGNVTVDVFWLLDDDETLSVGDTTRLQIYVRAGAETLADATREVTVEEGSRSYECDRSLRTLSHQPPRWSPDSYSRDAGTARGAYHS
jgi:hypothetical protein